MGARNSRPTKKINLDFTRAARLCVLQTIFEPQLQQQRKSSSFSSSSLPSSSSSSSKIPHDVFLIITSYIAECDFCNTVISSSPPPTTPNDIGSGSYVICHRCCRYHCKCMSTSCKIITTESTSTSLNYSLKKEPAIVPLCIICKNELIELHINDVKSFYELVEKVIKQQLIKMKMKYKNRPKNVNNKKKQIDDNYTNHHNWHGLLKKIDLFVII